jgi:replicative DNA helicase
MTMQENPLYDQAADLALIGAALVRPDVVLLCDVDASEFYETRCQHIWRAVRALLKAGHAADFVSISTALHTAGVLDQVGGPAFLSQAMLDTPSSYNHETYAAIVRDRARRRAMMQIASQLAQAATNLSKDIRQEQSRVIDEITNNTYVSGGAVDFREWLDLAVADIEYNMANPKAASGIPTGFDRWDDITDGLQVGEMVLLAGEPGKGKSILAMQAALQMSTHSPGAIYSAEMGKLQVMRRYLSSSTGVQPRAMRRGLSDDEYQKVLDSLPGLEKSQLYASDASQWTPAELRADLARLKRQHGIKFFIFDYFYLLRAPGENENERTMNAGRDLKTICKDLELAGLVVASMNKAGMNGGTPELSALRGNGQVVYDADVVLFLLDHIPDAGGMAQKDARTVLIRKGRDLEGPTMAFDLLKDTTRPRFFTRSESRGGSFGR